jgi:hypothetical protein
VVAEVVSALADLGVCKAHALRAKHTTKKHTNDLIGVFSSFHVAGDLYQDKSKF